MSKQDGYASRTAADLERKYNFGKTFAEVYGLASDAQKVAEEAKEAIDGLDQEAIFNLLTNFGQAQGVYRGDDGNVYINASYIKSGKLAADYIDAANLKVAAANITGTLTASQIDTANLKVAAANITGTLTAGQIDATNLKVSAANITGTLTIGQLPSTVATTGDIPTNTSDLTNDSGFVNSSTVTTITNNAISTATISANQINGGTITGINITGSSLTTAVQDAGLGNVTIENSSIDFAGARIERIYDRVGNATLNISADDILTVGGGSEEIRISVGDGFWVFGSSSINYYDMSYGYPKFMYGAQIV